MDDTKKLTIVSVVEQMKSSGMSPENISEITHKIVDISYSKDDNARWETKREIFSIVYQDII